MVVISNPYSGLAQYNEAHAQSLDGYRLDEWMNPMLGLAEAAYAEGAHDQLRACARDLLLWAFQYEFLGRQEGDVTFDPETQRAIAAALRAFATDWLAEAGQTAKHAIGQVGTDG